MDAELEPVFQGIEYEGPALFWPRAVVEAVFLDLAFHRIEVKDRLEGGRLVDRVWFVDGVQVFPALAPAAATA